MKGLNSNILQMLNKLYNLRGKDSVVLASLESDTKSAEDDLSRAEEEKNELQETIDNCSNQEYMLKNEGEKLQNALNLINKEDFKDIIDALEVDINLGDLKNKVDKALPKKIEDVTNERTKSLEQLVKTEDVINESNAKISELEIRKDEALQDQERLNRIIDLSLDGNSNITREEITSLLERFGFNEDEQREIAKMLMFPEDGLYEYDKLPEDKKTMVLEETSKVEETTEEAKEEVVVNKFKDSLNVDETKVEETNEEIPVNVMETKEVVEDKKEEVTKEVLIDLLTDLGFDYLDFTANDFEKMLQNYDKELFTKNVNLTEELGIAKDIYADNVEILYDKEIKDKIDKLINVGKKPQDIYLYPNILIKYNLEDLNSAINALHENGLEPKNVPLMAY